MVDGGLSKFNHLGDASNKYGRNGHQDTPECRQVREDFRRSCLFAGENPLEVDLPGDPAEGEEKEVVGVVPVPPAATNLPHPGLRPVRDLDGLDGRVDPGEWDTDPLERKQLGFTSHLWTSRSLSLALALALSRGSASLCRIED